MSNTTDLLYRLEDVDGGYKITCGSQKDDDIIMSLIFNNRIAKVAGKLCSHSRHNASGFQVDAILSLVTEGMGLEVSKKYTVIYYGETGEVSFIT